MSRLTMMMLLAVLVTGCEYISNLRVVSEPKSKMLVVTCDGTKINWDFCYEAAARHCPSGYVISDKQEQSDKLTVADRTQISRSIYFKCN